MHIPKIISQFKPRKSNQNRNSTNRAFSDYASLSLTDNSSFSNANTLSEELEDRLSFDELEYIFDISSRSRYHQQDVQLNSKQELDLELARLTGLLERSERRRLISQDYHSTE